MSTLWSHIHSQLDHGASMSFTVTKTGIEGELMITIHPGVQNEALGWFPPPIFRNNCKVLDETFEEEFRKLPIGKIMDTFRNRVEFIGALEAMSALMKSINESKNLPRRKQKAKDTKKLADSHFRLGNWQDALDQYVILNNLEPDEYAAVRIETCLGMIAKKTRDSLEGPEKEELTDPFPKEGFGNTER